MVIGGGGGGLFVGGGERGVLPKLKAKLDPELHFHS